LMIKQSKSDNIKSLIQHPKWIKKIQYQLRGQAQKNGEHQC
jgi:hypothetical protein